MTKVPFAALFAGCLIAFPAAAQDASQERGVPLQSSPAATDDKPAVQGPRRADTILWHADDLMGKDIRNARDETLGSVQDIIINAPQGAVHVLVDVGGVVGIGEERVAIGLHELSVTQDGALVLDSTADQLAARPQYRFPESPTTGSIRPGAKTPQAAAGQGQPSQGPQYVPGATSDVESEVREERAQVPDDAVRDTGLAQILRGGVTGPASTEADVTFDNRGEFLDAAGRRLQDFHQRIETRPLDPATEQDLAEQYEEAASRYQALQAASDEAWPTALKNFRMSLARLQDNWQQAEGVPGPGQTVPPAGTD